MDRALISVEHYGDLAEHLRVARQYGVGLEMQEFSDPNVLDGDWRSLLDRYARALDGFTGCRHFPHPVARGDLSLSRRFTEQERKTETDV